MPRNFLAEHVAQETREAIAIAESVLKRYADDPVALMAIACRAVKKLHEDNRVAEVAAVGMVASTSQFHALSAETDDEIFDILSD